MNDIPLDTSNVDAYLKLRKQLFSLNTRIFEITNKDTQQAAAELLGIFDENEKTIVIEEEIDYERFVDFVTHEYRDTSGKTYAQKLLESDEDLTDEERTFLTVKQQARASLYEVIAINSAENTLTLRNLFERNEAPVTIIDIGLSNSAKPNHSLIFTRVIRLPKFNVISGASSVFLKRKYEKARKAYEKQYKNLPAYLTEKEKRYIAMFHVNRVHGELMITKPPQDIKDTQTQLESKKG